MLAGIECRAALGGAPILPDDGAASRGERGAIPQHQRLALIRDADGVDGDTGFVDGRAPRSNQRLKEDLCVVLDLTGNGIMLRHFLVAATEDRAVRTDDEGRGAGGALIEGENDGHGWEGKSRRASGPPFPLSFRMTFSTLLYHPGDDGIALVTVNRPDKLNALNATVLTELGAVLQAAEANAAVRGLIVTGAGPKAFVAGADIAELAALDREQAVDFATRGSRVLRQIEQCRKPVIAAINGFALGGGCELAMACHMRIAVPHARFGQPEVKLGLIPGFGGTVRLPRLVGRGRALELLLTGAMIDADEALRIGLINRKVPADALIEESRTLMRTILAQSPVAVALCLQAVDEELDLPVDQAHCA